MRSYYLDWCPHRCCHILSVVFPCLSLIKRHLKKVGGLNNQNVMATKMRTLVCLKIMTYKYFIISCSGWHISLYISFLFLTKARNNCLTCQSNILENTVLEGGGLNGISFILYSCTPSLQVIHSFSLSII